MKQNKTIKHTISTEGSTLPKRPSVRKRTCLAIAAAMVLASAVLSQAPTFKKRTWTLEELKVAATTIPEGELFTTSLEDEIQKEGVMGLDSTFIVDRSPALVYTLLSDKDALKDMFSKIKRFDMKEVLDDGFLVDVVEGVLFWEYAYEAKIRLDEGDPTHRKMWFTTTKDNTVWTRWDFFDVGHHGFTEVRFRAHVDLGWVPDVLLEFLLGYGNEEFVMAMRDALHTREDWPADKKAPIRTAKGQRDRDAWRAAQKPAPAPATDAVPIAAPLDAASAAPKATAQNDAAASTTSDGGIQTPAGPVTTPSLTAEPVAAESVITKPETGETPPARATEEKPPAN